MTDPVIGTRNSYPYRALNSVTPSPLYSSQPFGSILSPSPSNNRSSIEREYKIPGHSYLIPWGIDYPIGKPNPSKLSKIRDFSLNITDIEGTHNKKSYNGLSKSIDTSKIFLPDLKPYFPRRKILCETVDTPPSPEMSRKMGLLEQLQYPKPKYLTIKRKYGAPVKYGSPIRIVSNEKLSPKIGSYY
jgi:hypothetical protein